MISPRSDPDFAVHPVHGTKGQRKLFNSVLPYCKQFRTAVDAGAHIGLWTRMLAVKFAEVWAFEPVQENYSCLKDNVRVTPNVTCLQMALGDHNGACAMHLPEQTNSGCWYATECDPTRLTTQLVTLDTFFDLIQNVDFIKLDVEGAESLVLSGALDIIQRDRPVIVLEDNGLGVLRYGDQHVCPQDLLYGKGYKQVWRLNKDVLFVPC